MSEAIGLFLIRLHDISRNNFVFTKASKTSVSPPTRTSAIVIITLTEMHYISEGILFHLQVKPLRFEKVGVKLQQNKIIHNS